MPDNLLSALAASAILAIVSSCAPKPPSAGVFVLVEGARIGKLDIVAVDYSGGLVRDSVVERTARVSATHAITFTYPGKTITVMKIFRNGRQVKVCDEAAYDKPHWATSSKPLILDNTVQDATGRRFDFETGDEVNRKGAMRHNLECQLELGSGEIEVALYEFDGLVSRYRLRDMEGR